MLPNTNGKAKSKEQDSYLKKKNSNALYNNSKHIRSQSSSSTSLSHEMPSSNAFVVENNNKRGWLESTSAVQVNPSRSLDISRKSSSNIPSTTMHIKKPLITDVSQKDILGAVSDEDIFKLTELTSRLPDVPSVNKAKHHHRQRTDENITRKRNGSLNNLESPDNNGAVEDDLVTRAITRDENPGTAPASPTSTRNSSDMLMLDTPESNETKRRSWLYKSLIKPYKKGNNNSKSNSGKSSTSTSLDQQQNDENSDVKSPAASMVEEFYRNMESSNNEPIDSNINKRGQPGILRIHTIGGGTTEGFKSKKLKSQKRFSNSPFHTRSNSSHVSPGVGETSVSSPTNNVSRRHSFDSFHSLIREAEEEPVNSAIKDQVETIDTQNFQDRALARWDQERKQDREKPTYGYSHEERPNFHLSISTNNVPQQDDSNNNNNSNIPTSDDDELIETRNTGTNTPAIVIEDIESNTIDSRKEDLVTFMFDYYSLPVEVKSLIDAYEHKGKAERKKMIVKYKKKTDTEEKDQDSIQNDDEDEEDEDDVEEDDEEDEEEEEDDESKDDIVDYRDIITGNCVDGKSQKDTRDIAVVTTSRSDNIEFTKLIQIAIKSSSSSPSVDNEPLLDLHVSLFGDTDSESDTNVHQEEFQDAILSIEKSLEKFQDFRLQSADFLRDHMRTMESLNLYNEQEYIPKLPRTYSFPVLRSMDSTAISSSDEQQQSESISTSSGSSLSSSISSSEVIVRPVSETSRELYHRNTQSMYGGSNEEYKSRIDPFDLRQREINSLVTSLKKDLDKFKDSLEKTEDLVRDVQVDMDDTRNRMETYIKDIPESHYSALKKLEVDIESILSKRAKNPWLETGYALLSYLLTLFALVVWIIIYMLKWGKKVVLFPKKLWQAYSDYLVERNQAVKKASVLSVSGLEKTSSSNSIARNEQHEEHPLLFQRSNRVSSTRRDS